MIADIKGKDFWNELNQNERTRAREYLEKEFWSCTRFPNFNLPKLLYEASSEVGSFEKGKQYLRFFLTYDDHYDDNAELHERKLREAFEADRSVEINHLDMGEFVREDGAEGGIYFFDDILSYVRCGNDHMNLERDRGTILNQPALMVYNKTNERNQKKEYDRRLIPDRVQPRIIQVSDECVEGIVSEALKGRIHKSNRTTDDLSSTQCAGFLSGRIRYPESWMHYIRDIVSIREFLIGLEKIIKIEEERK